jgi:hypothetical protein
MAEPFDRFLGLDLRRVVVAPKQEGHALRVLGLELYEDGVIARFLLMERSGRARSEGAGAIAFTLTDDLGTAYEWTRTGSTLVLPKDDRPNPSSTRGGTPILRGDALFVPRVPDDVMRLTVVTAEQLVQIPLT